MKRIQKYLDLSRINWKFFQVQKKIFQLCNLKNPRNKQILFIVGCQRSGTTLLASKVFGRDFDSKIYNEYSVLTNNDISGPRLNPLDSVRKEIKKNKVKLIVIKTIVESQNASNLLEYFDNSKALWLYRHYKDVALSNLKKFGIRNGIKDLRPIVERNFDDWRAEKSSKNITKIVNKYFFEDMDPNDAAALFWFLRNSIFFELNLRKNPNVMLCRYEQLVRNPNDTVKNIYRFIGIKYPGKRILADVHSNSVDKGQKLHLSQEIDLMCRDLYDKLNTIHKNQIITLSQS
jgi:hypothetical protein